MSGSTERMTEPARKSLLAKLSLSLAATVVLLLGVEGAVRARQWMKYGTTGQIYEFVLDPASGLMIPIPGRRTATMSINSLGFRGPELGPKEPGDLRVAFLGGSTTFCAEASSDEATWPALLTAALAERFPAHRFDYANAGVGGYSTVQSLANLEHRVAPLEPDVIVVYHATNDLTRNTRQQAVESGVYRGHADQSSLLGRWSLAWYLVEKNLLLRDRQAVARRGETRLQPDYAALDERFREDLRTLLERARREAPVVAVATFSIHLRPEQSPEERFAASNTSLYYMPYMTPDTLLEAFRGYNEVIREVAAEQGCVLLECAQSIPGDGEHFNDSVHLRDPGCRALAACAAEKLAAAPELQALAAR